MHLVPQGRVTGDPPCHDNSTRLRLYQGASCFCYQHIDDRLLKTCHDIVATAFPLRRRRERPTHVIVKKVPSPSVRHLQHMSTHGRFYATQAEIERLVVQHGSWEVYS